MNLFTHPTKMYDIMDLPKKVHAAASDITDDDLLAGAFSMGVSKVTQANILLTAFTTQVRLFEEDASMELFLKIESDRIRAVEEEEFSTDACRYGPIIGEAVSLISCVDESDVPPDVIRTVSVSGAHEYALCELQGNQHSSRNASNNLVRIIPEQFAYLFLWGLEVIPKVMRVCRASGDVSEE